MSKINREGAKPSVDSIESLIAGLADADEVARRRSRQSLAAIGKPAVPSLVKLLAGQNIRLRVEAARTLKDMADPSTAPALIKVLDSQEFDVRWAAAEGLVNIGQPAIVPLLKALVALPDSAWLRQGAHHVLTHMAEKDLTIEHHVLSHKPAGEDNLGKVLTPVVTALNDLDSPVKVPIAAQAALDKLAGRS